MIGKYRAYHLLILVFLMITPGEESYGQTIISSHKNKPDTSAILEVESQERGMLIPRMTSAQRDSILNPAEGLVIYNTDSHSLEFFNTQTWVNTQEVLNRNTPCGSLTLYHFGMEYGTVEYNGRCWLDRNIGAQRVAVNDKDSLGCGGYFQWGRGIDGHQIPSSDTTGVLSNSNFPGHDKFILSNSDPYDWLLAPDSSLWGDSSGYLNNPCPHGWRAPTLAEWTMSSEDWINSQSAFFSPLRLTNYGYRHQFDGSIQGTLTSGIYWTRQPNGEQSFALNFGNAGVSIWKQEGARARGGFVRCIREDESYIPVSKLIGGNSIEEGYCLSSLPGGGSVGAGCTQSFGTGGLDYLIMKMDEAGEIIWAQSHGFVNNDICYSVKPTWDGGFILNGEASWGDTYHLQMLVMKLDSAGNQQWYQAYGSTGDETGYDVIQDSDSGFVSFGTREDPADSDLDMYIVKSDTGGNWVWGYTIGTSENDHGQALIKDHENGYAMLGHQENGALGNDDMKFVTYDSLMNIQLSYLLGGDDIDRGKDLTLSHDSCYVMAGYTYSYGAGGADYYVRKMDRSGNTVWSCTYGGSQNDFAESIILTNDNGFAVIGSTSSFGKFADRNAWLVKIDADGQFEWSYAYGIDGFQDGYSVVQRFDSSFLMLGSASTSGLNAPGSGDISLVEFLQDGTACVGNHVDIIPGNPLAPLELQSNMKSISSGLVVTSVDSDQVKSADVTTLLNKNSIPPKILAPANRGVVTLEVVTICK